jgi:hypothetical protein
MSDFLAQLVTRSRGSSEGLRPRLGSRFEPAPIRSGSTWMPTELDLEVESSSPLALSIDQTPFDVTPERLEATIGTVISPLPSETTRGAPAADGSPEQPPAESIPATPRRGDPRRPPVIPDALKFERRADRSAALGPLSSPADRTGHPRGAARLEDPRPPSIATDRGDEPSTPRNDQERASEPLRREIQGLEERTDSAWPDSAAEVQRAAGPADAPSAARPLEPRAVGRPRDPRADRMGKGEFEQVAQPESSLNTLSSSELARTRAARVLAANSRATRIAIQRPAGGDEQSNRRPVNHQVDLQAAEAPAETIVNVSIGRVEVRAIAQSPRAKPTPRRAPDIVGLAAYLKQREPGGRG